MLKSNDGKTSWNLETGELIMKEAVIKPINNEFPYVFEGITGK